MNTLNSTLYLNIIWHQHQPLYLDPESGQLRGPWVRTHATKDYYDMAAILREFPEIHCTFNLTSSLLVQLQDYYIARLRPFVDVKKRRIDAGKFFAAWKGKTDPWIDLALKPTSTFDDKDKRVLLNDTWNAFHITDVMLGRFPEYKALKERHGRGEHFTEQELRNVKFWFFLAYFDPDFLERPVKLVDGSVVDLTDLVVGQTDGTYHLKKTITEEDCNRIVVETYKIMVNIVPVHKELMYHPRTHKGQIDVITTPFYHPILPLLVDSDAARICQPADPLPGRFHYPQDAERQVAKSIRYYRKTFGSAPRGLWPAEGAVSQDIIGTLRKNNIQWLATDQHILERSTPSGLPNYFPYSVDGGDDIAIVFRDTALSDKIGFTYQSWKGADAANDFLKNVLEYAPPSYEPDRLLTVILDGENAWEWYKEDNDGKEFLRTLYGGLSAMHKARQVLTVTMSEFIAGNPKRHIRPHPIHSMNAIERLHPGSWINANYDTWIGNREKNQAWEYLRTAREDLARSGVAHPALSGKPPAPSTKRWYASKAWEAIYAAEGSDWFWWYGTKQFVLGGTKPFDASFIGLLKTVYRYARLAGGSMPARTFTPITSPELPDTSKQGTMKRSSIPLPEQS